MLKRLLRGTALTGISTALLLSLSSTQLASAQQDPELTQLYFAQVLRQFEQGAVAYEKGDFETAYADLSLAAQRGVKDAQYLLGFMYLRGEYAPQSLPVGLAWIGTALEVDNDDWLELYTQIYTKLSPQQQVYIDSRVDKYIELYGMDTQRMSCKKTARTGSRRKILQCVKTEDVNTPLYSLEAMPEGYEPQFSCAGDWPCLAGETRVYSDHDELDSDQF